MALSSVSLSRQVLLPVKATPKQSFKEIFRAKQSSHKDPVFIDAKQGLDLMINNHEQATQTVRTLMLRTDYTPEKLLNLQYETGILFLREQMFSKTAELSANTLKNFIQMQV